MSELLIFAQVDVVCAGPEAREEKIPVELQSTAAVGDIITQLAQTGAVQGLVNVQWQGTTLKPSALLAEVGLGSQSVVQVVRGLTEESDDELLLSAEVQDPESFFLPPLAVQRYAHARELLDGLGVTRFVDGGAGDCTGAKFWLQNAFGSCPIQAVVAVDRSRPAVAAASALGDAIVESHRSYEAFAFPECLPSRCCPVKEVQQPSEPSSAAAGSDDVWAEDAPASAEAKSGGDASQREGAALFEVWEGNLANYDAVFKDHIRAVGCEALVLVEVVEHSRIAESTGMLSVALGRYRFKHVIVSTPDQNFNCVWPGYHSGRYRDPDHKWEMGGEEFEAWCREVAYAHGYSVSFSAVGQLAGAAKELAPDNQFLASQFAVFSRPDAEGDRASSLDQCGGRLHELGELCARAESENAGRCFDQLPMIARWQAVQEAGDMAAKLLPAAALLDGLVLDPDGVSLREWDVERLIASGSAEATEGGRLRFRGTGVDASSRSILLAPTWGAPPPEVPCWRTHGGYAALARGQQVFLPFDRRLALRHRTVVPVLNALDDAGRELEQEVGEAARNALDPSRDYGRREVVRVSLPLRGFLSNLRQRHGLHAWLERNGMQVRDHELTRTVAAEWYEVEGDQVIVEVCGGCAVVAYECFCNPSSQYSEED
eukprot:Hpha_TRINITY_DN19134_c0_g1::TRINITY_DN19134_c0_g1_i1::g.94752::m.94752